MVIFGTNGLIVANISLGSAEIVLMRTFLGSLFLLAIVLVKRSFSFADLKADLVPATMGGAALGLNWVLLFSAYRSAGVGLSTLTYYCGPIIVLALSPVLFREKLTWNKLLAIAAVAVGMFCITGDIEPGSDVQTGILFGGGAALLYASLIVANKRVKRLSGLNCAMYELIVAFFVVLIYLVASNVKLPRYPRRGGYRMGACHRPCEHGARVLSVLFLTAEASRPDGRARVLYRPAHGTACLRSFPRREAVRGADSGRGAYPRWSLPRRAEIQKN